MKVLKANGITGFIESATLIGYMRHGAKLVPWDNDGDIGMLYEECLRADISKQDI